MVGTTHIPLNFGWFPPHLQFPVVIYDLQYATNGSPIVLRRLPTSRLKKRFLNIFFNTSAGTDLHNCLTVYRNETVFASVLRDHELGEVIDYISMKLCQPLLIYRRIDNSPTLQMTALTPAPNYSCLLPPLSRV